MQRCEDRRAWGRHVPPLILSNLQESWSKVSHAVACSVQAELGQMTATVYYDANSVALDSKLLILQNTFAYRIQHESH